MTNLMLGDNIESLKKLEANSIDAVVTDPPYGLSFMSKKWDYDVPSVDFWKEVYRVLKPGGHVLSFGGTRTYHRMTVNIEDAGFEIRDQIMWLYGSGFPKSRNIGKDVEKVNVGGLSKLIQIGTKKGIVATNHHELAKGEKPKGFSYKTASHTVSHSEVASARTQTTGDIPVYEINNEWEGWGTALKPANEPICVARKPLSEKSIAENVLRWGTGGINIDGCRIGTEGGTKRDGQSDKVTLTNTDLLPTKSLNRTGHSIIEINEGRFPANIIFDEEAGAALDEQSGISKSNTKSGIVEGKDANVFNDGETKKTGHKTKIMVGDYNDKGGASRFFYCAKVSKKERNLGLEEGKNRHPTIKPINLMAYLCRLITPPNGTVLDPFMGSGSTGIAARLEGFNFVGMEMDEDYFKVAETRVKSYEKYRELKK